MFIIYTLCLKKNDTDVAHYNFNTHQLTVVIFRTDTISGVHVSPGSAETLVRRAGITKHRLIAYSVSNTSARNNKNWLSASKLYCATSVSFFKQSVHCSG